MSKTSENTLEQTALAWFEKLAYSVAFAPTISLHTPPHKHHNHNQLPPEANNP
jgi:hypothetical protein